MTRYRQELVGKRFLSINNSCKLFLPKIVEWPWRSGIIRASSHNDANDEELTVLVEFDDSTWESREWVRVYDRSNFQIFFVENTLVWAPRKDPRNQSRNAVWPALSFTALVDNPHISKTKTQPIEFLTDQVRLFVDYAGLVNYQDGDESTKPITVERVEVRNALRRWVDHHDGQVILLTTPSVAVGNRVQVYRAEGTTQWYTAVIGSYNEITRELNLTDDTVLESHSEDPSLVHVRLIGDGVVESIRKGEIIGITPRRRTCTLSNATHVGHYTRSSRNPVVSANPTSKNPSLSKKINKKNVDLGENKDKPSRGIKTEDNPSGDRKIEEKIPKKRFKLKRPFPTYDNTKNPNPNPNPNPKPNSNPNPENDVVNMDVDVKGARIHNFTEDCSDSGISDKSGLRSSDERSASRSSDSSRLSDERSGSRPSVEENFDQANPINVWRDPKMLTGDEINVRHIQSVQHLKPINKFQYSGIPHYAPRNQWRTCEGEGLMDSSRIKSQDHMKCDRERAQREAVQQHFEESLRLASQDSSLNWTTSSVVKNNPEMDLTSRGKGISPLIPKTDVGVRYLPQDKRGYSNSYVDESKWQREQQEHWLLQQRDLQMPQIYHNLEPCLPNPQRKSTYNYPTGKPSLVPGVPPVSSVQLPKSEPSFNLYGYQPFQHSFIKAEQLDNRPKNPPPSLSTNRDLPRSDKFSYSPANVTTSTYSRHVYTNATNLGVINPTPSNKSVEPPVALIQQGLVPNPMYNYSSLSSPGITTGTPIIRSPRLSTNVGYQRYQQHQPQESSTTSTSQAQPLNLETGEKRKIVTDLPCRKKPKTDSPVLSRVSAPLPLVVSASTTISTEVNPSSKSGFINSYLSFVNATRQDGGGAKDSEKSVNPPSCATKLKKAWLQRHSDEDSSVNKQLLITNSSSNNVETSTNVNGNCVEQIPSMSADDESTNSAAETEFELAQEKIKLKTEDEDEKEVAKIDDVSGKLENVVNQPKKRGRKPKIKNIKQESVKKTKNYFEKSPLSKLKRTGVSFLQDGSCCDVAPKLNKCRECRMTNQRSKKMLNIFCRFYAFRKLRYSKNGYMAYSGFAEPKAASEDDMKLWLPQPDNPPTDLNLETSKFILSHVGNQFCDLVHQEHEAQGVHIGEDKTVAWKRVVQGVREMCDVCETTLFNYHWACGKCGFVVCIDCYKARKSCNMKIIVDEKQNNIKDSDRYSWMLCNNRQAHEQDKLILTQIIADNALWEVGKLVHTVGKRWNIAMHCVCVANTKDSKQQPMSNGICKQLMSAVSQCFEEKKPPVNYTPDVASSPLSWLADVALNESNNKMPIKSTTTTKEEEHFSTLRELLIRPSGNKRNGNNSSVVASLTAIPRKPLNTLDDVINCMIEQSVNKQDDNSTREDKLLLHYTRRFPQPRSGWDPLPIRIYTLSESQLLFPDVPHSWLCAGRLLRLHDPVHRNNIKLFQEQWKRGQPVLVSEVSRALDMTLWHPEAFARDFGDIKNDLVNCHTGNIVPDQPMRKFWEGFENLTKRMQDDTGEYMLLKLKDWPPGDDFSEMLPSRFQDLMKVLPLPEYTHRNGRLNLAGRLPDCFVRPDLGPKMYNAYGSALFPSKGTTNLHLDISDAVNVMVYVGIPKDGNSEQHIKEALKAIDEAGCDILTRKRVREAHERPGALWHIYNARDADKIRDLLNKVAIERGEKLEAHHDPIHDQSWYLDAVLRNRLYMEYGVEGYAIAQCLGDAVFIPAGAPHQVRNLHSCIKVAEDFVSPENVSHCFTLTQEFRHLSDTHSNHEDKLQVKNIIYHAVRDALSVLLANEKHKDPS